jgi:hypothetical protein
MTYRFIYSNSESNRIIPAVLIDKRAAIPEIKNQVGSIIKAYTDARAALVTEDVLFYKIETDLGNLAGYFTLKVVRYISEPELLPVYVALLQATQLRPAFEQFSGTISGLISNFITQSEWSEDYLQYG